MCVHLSVKEKNKKKQVIQAIIKIKADPMTFFALGQTANQMSYFFTCVYADINP